MVCYGNIFTSALEVNKMYLNLYYPRVKAGKNISTLIPGSLRGDGKGTELVSGETVPADLREG
jgi:hypothetical protein